jgi:hypothetical protein
MFTTFSKQFLPLLLKNLAKSIFIWKDEIRRLCLVLNGMGRNCLLGHKNMNIRGKKAKASWQGQTQGRYWVWKIKLRSRIIISYGNGLLFYKSFIYFMSCSIFSRVQPKSQAHCLVFHRGLQEARKM